MVICFRADSPQTRAHTPTTRTNAPPLPYTTLARWSVMRYIVTCNKWEQGKEPKKEKRKKRNKTEVKCDWPSALAMKIVQFQVMYPTQTQISCRKLCLDWVWVARPPSTEHWSFWRLPVDGTRGCDWKISIPSHLLVCGDEVSDYHLNHLISSPTTFHRPNESIWMGAKLGIGDYQGVHVLWSTLMNHKMGPLDVVLSAQWSFFYY